MAPNLTGGRPGTQGNTELSTNKATIGAIVLQKTNMERFRAPLSLGLVPVNVGEEQERVTNTL